MRIFVPYTEIGIATRYALLPYNYKPLKMIGDDGYLDFFKQRWAERESFIICEHDVAFWPGAIEGLEACPRHWCAYGVPHKDAVWSADGNPDNSKWCVPEFTDGAIAYFCLVKFEREFIENYPDVWEDFADADVLWPDRPDRLKTLPSWGWLDTWLDHYMRARDVICHQHHPGVLNVNPVALKVVEL